jgi:hypothetical protein
VSPNFWFEEKAMKKLFTVTIPVIATNHITESTAKDLEKQGDANPWTMCAPYEYGFFYAQDQPVEGTPQDLAAVMSWARTQGYQWVRLDADGDAVDGLPSYVW